MKRNSIILIGSLALSACYAKTGTEGNLQITYAHGFLNSTRTPIGVGLRAIARVSDLNGNPSEINGVSSMDDDVFSISQIIGNDIYFQANHIGKSELTIDAGELGDVFILEAREISSVEFRELMVTQIEGEARPVAGSTMPFHRQHHKRRQSTPPHRAPLAGFLR